ncbi:MAG: hypothetical protein IPK63_23710 [Candidatus Competibacteraceae bacterium]|nr:hypothetical protein [Candidatus Competibacteraceae bacterium]
MSETELTPLCELAAKLRPFNVGLSYPQIQRRAWSAIIPTRRISGRVFAVGKPADIAKLLLHEESKRGRRRTAA